MRVGAHGPHRKLALLVGLAQLAQVRARRLVLPLVLRASEGPSAVKMMVAAERADAGGRVDECKSQRASQVRVVRT